MQNAVELNHESMQQNDELLRCTKIVKSYSGITVLQDVDFKMGAGEVHALVGENGAGKSTLTKIVAGVVPYDCGEMYLGGEAYTPAGLRGAIEKGVAIVHQESALNSSLNIGENMLIGAFSSYSNKLGLLNWKKIKKKTKELLEVVELDINPGILVSSLEPGEQRLVEIARALSYNPRLLILDEVTAALNYQQTQLLFRLMREFSSKGGSIIYISHRLEEIFHSCSMVTVLRDGKIVDTRPVSEVTENELTKLMIGRYIPAEAYSNCGAETDEKDLILSVQGLTLEGYFEDISFNAYRGKCLSFAGLSGCGSDQILSTLFGLHKPDRGEIRINGKPFKVRSPQMSIKQGISYIPKDRITEGLIQHFSITNNISLCNLDAATQFLFVSKEKERELAQEYIERFSIDKKCCTACNHLSGGNQQKVLLAKWIACKTPIIMLNNPTRGVDVGVKFEIYNLLEQLMAQNVAIILVSEELPEVIRLSDSVITLRNGKVTGSFNKTKELTEELLINYIV